jgi:mannose-1-phosphate guanylyltransferase
MVKKAVLLVGGHSKGTRFRPLSLDVPKPLFPLGGIPLLTHHLQALAKVADMTEVSVLGFFQPQLFDEWIAECSKQFPFKIRYMEETKGLGTGGGLFKYRNEILAGNPSHLIVLNCDILCAFPLPEMLAFHDQHKAVVTLLGKKVSATEASHYGCMVADDQCAVLHFAEKPETFVSDLANCGVYIFAPEVFQRIQVATERKAQLASSHDELHLADSQYVTRKGDQVVSLETEVLAPMASRGQMYVFETTDFFLQVKHAGAVTRANEVVLRKMRATNPSALAVDGGNVKGPAIVGDVSIHPTATVPASCKLGPNVSIGPNVVLKEGVRVAHSIISAGCLIGEHCCLMYAVFGRGCTIGRWCRIEGVPPGNVEKLKEPGLTLFGNDVSTAPELIIRTSVVLPHKSLSESYHNEVLL